MCFPRGATQRCPWQAPTDEMSPCPFRRFPHRPVRIRAGATHAAQHQLPCRLKTRTLPDMPAQPDAPLVPAALAKPEHPAM
eukprot:364982-Chlamydomonas_euryale.AAC.6